MDETCLTAASSVGRTGLRGEVIVVVSFLITLPCLLFSFDSFAVGEILSAEGFVKPSDRSSPRSGDTSSPSSSLRSQRIS